MKLTIFWHTIWNRIDAKLRNEPTNEEAKAAIKALRERVRAAFAEMSR